ncbi:MAG: hypothetical protein ACTSR8_07850 [Promethearchaeota archaeon]
MDANLRNWNTYKLTGYAISFSIAYMIIHYYFNIEELKTSENYLGARICILLVFIFALIAFARDYNFKYLIKFIGLYIIGFIIGIFIAQALILVIAPEAYNEVFL